ncbi:hypothetical protein BJF83_00410 [Nocardiopsis sp. CNR-923]|uniref:DUF397 domain-containing protein n=1 Tax=Nocardiopsis sp. CNR-923 TaxID=1904965 RepID=UPI000962C5A3|nr:DUF397 domain-containing protein [Nocardiopsis sp. CNR-923]OLT29125.1 hypothetical protein BJF83_00410 [Nocardiopsis sp. CNR-923]
MTEAWRLPESRWWKSSYSGSKGGDCVEVARSWRKSSHSSVQGGNCIEVADGACHTRLRDSKNPGIGYFSFAPGEWDAFLASAKRD